MIELFVNNHEVVLPDDFEITLIEENAEITSSGEYTLDITTSLLESKNAIAFSFINRLNNSNVGKTAVARLVDNGVVRNGIITIMDNTDIQVTHQFLAGNSEMRYNAKADGRKIWELDWGVAAAIDFNTALRSCNFPGYGAKTQTTNTGGIDLTLHWMQEYVCAPVMVDSEIMNNYTISPDTGAPPSSINGISGKTIMQPYLLYYINKLPEVLGYTLTSNILNVDERAIRMYLVNSVDSLHYADALPDLTVSEFIDAIETFFNVTVIVNSRDNTISIQTIQSNLATKKTVHIDNAIDGFKRKFGEESKSKRFDFTSIRYDLPNSKFFKYQCLESRIAENCKVYEFPNFAAIETAVLAGSGVAPDKFVLFRDMETMNDYAFMESTGLGKPTVDCYLYAFWSPGEAAFVKEVCLLNKFKATSSNNTNELVLKICPSEIIRNKMMLSKDGGTVAVYVQMPKSSNSYYISQTKGLIESIDGSESTINRLDKLEVALYTGRMKTFFQQQIGYSFDIPTLYPFSHIDVLPEFSGDPWGSALAYLKIWKNTIFTTMATTTLKLMGMNGVLANYHQESIIDTSKEYYFTFPDGPDITVKNIFVINNLKYIPISFERRKSNKSSTVYGSFYRML